MTEEILNKINEAKVSKRFILSNKTITTEVWDKIGKSSDLKRLAIYDSKFKKIPDNIPNLLNLKYLTLKLSGNPINIIKFGYVFNIENTTGLIHKYFK